MLARRVQRSRGDSGQASLLLLGVLTLLVGLAVVLFAFGSALGSKGRHQRAADLAAVSAGQVMRDLYPRLFEPPVLANGLPNPRHLPLAVYLAMARRAAVRGAHRNGVKVSGADVSFPGGGFAPTRVGVTVRGVARVRTRLGDGRRGGRRGEGAPVRARGGGGDLSGPQRAVGDAGVRLGRRLRRAAGLPAWASRCAPTWRPRSIAWPPPRAARRVSVSVVSSAFRSDAEQARLFAQNPNPKWVAPPGTSLHRYGPSSTSAPRPPTRGSQRTTRRFGFVALRWVSCRFPQAGPRQRRAR